MAKGGRGSGNLVDEHFVRCRTLIRAACGLVPLWSAAVWACPPTVRLDGDPDLTRAIGASLIERGISTDGTSCPAMEIRVARRAGAIVVSNGSADGPAEREVSDVRTAATVIESWVRTDVEEPLLSSRRMAEERGSDAAPTTVASRPLAPPLSPTPALGLRAFTTAETSFGSDQTTWLGAQIGACIMMGPFCGGARIRFATVVDGPGLWQGQWDRHAVEVLLGLDWPLSVRSLTLAPGAAIGAGWTHTHEEGTSGGAQTAGVRAEAHLSLSYPVSQKLAVESTIALDFMQALDRDMSSVVPLPGDPHLLGRIGVGVRFGGL
jgi:hypothetical protein